MTRIVLYSHDTQGMGHIRRNLALARILTTRTPSPDILLISGAAEAALFPRPPGIDVVGLPSVVKTAEGVYRPRHLEGLTLGQLLSLRARLAETALTSFAPDLLIVDRHPLGFRGELEPSLQALAGRCRIVLGLRDVIDHPAATRAEWKAEDGAAALAAWYDAVWVYGDRALYDLTTDLDIPRRLTSAVQFTGYLAHGRDGLRRGRGRRGTTVVGMVGGGSDGGLLAEAFVQAAAQHGQSSHLVLGSQMSAPEVAHIRRLAAGSRNLKVVDFVAQMASLLDSARAVVSMAGYNTACEVLERKVPSMMVPRVTPREEQLMRARLLQSRGLTHLVHPERLDADSIAQWVSTDGRGRGQTRWCAFNTVDLNGLSRVRSLAEALLNTGELADVAV